MKQLAPDDFLWVTTPEPHSVRRKQILTKYPEIKQLMKVDPYFKWTVIALVMTQLLTYYLLRNITSFITLVIIAYCFGGVVNHSLMVAIHEIAHNQAFGSRRPLANKLFAIVANIPLGFPFAATYKKYHLDHHRYQGDEILDPDVPSRLEASMFNTPASKWIWLILQPILFGLRPLSVNPYMPTIVEICNFIAQLSVDIIIGLTMGWHIVAYMCGATLLASGLHPVAGHSVCKHNLSLLIVNKRDEIYNDDLVNNDKAFMSIQETSSYYGPLNMVTFNVGYHVEHHDFPSIPYKLLPKVRLIAPEFYDSLYSHKSWTAVLWQYITNSAVGPFARVKRPHSFDEY